MQGGLSKACLEKIRPFTICNSVLGDWRDLSPRVFHDRVYLGSLYV